MRRLVRLAALVFGALAAATGTSSAGPGDGLVVTGARIDIAPRGRIRLSALIAGPCGFRQFDVHQGGVALRIDAVEIVSLAETRRRLRETRAGSGRFVLRERSGRRKVEITIDVARGSFRLRGAGIDLSGIAIGGPFSVPVVLSLAAEVRSGTTDFRDDGRTWRFDAARDAAPALDGPQPFRRLGPDFGDGPRTFDVSVARTDAEWRALWQRSALGSFRPDVDLAQEMVVGVTLGARDPNSEGASVTGVTLDANGLRIDVVESVLTPSPFLGTTGWWRPTNILLVAVPRTALPVTVGRVTIEVPRGTPTGCASH